MEEEITPTTPPDEGLQPHAVSPPPGVPAEDVTDPEVRKRTKRERAQAAGRAAPLERFMLSPPMAQATARYTLSADVRETENGDAVVRLLLLDNEGISSTPTRWGVVSEFYVDLEARETAPLADPLPKQKPKDGGGKK